MNAFGTIANTGIIRFERLFPWTAGASVGLLDLSRATCDLARGGGNSITRGWLRGTSIRGCRGREK